MKNTVSLLPVEYRSELENAKKLGGIRKKMRVVALVLLAAVLVLSVWRITGSLDASSLRDEQQQVQTNADTLAEYRALYQEKSMLYKKALAIENSDPQWVTVIAEIADALPSGVWLQSLSTSQETAEDGTMFYLCTMQCTAVNNTGVAKTLAALKESTVVSDAVCSSTATDENGTQFTVAVTVVPVQKR